MALSEDSRALLQLLLGKGQSYADIADLLGVTEDEVRSRANAALTELGDRDPDANVPLTDYLLGQADPITRADVARHLAEDPDDQDLADTLSAKLKLLAPSASLPNPNRPGIAASRKSARSEGRKSSDKTSSGTSGKSAASDSGQSKSRKAKDPLDLSIKQRRLIALLLGVALLVVVVALLVTKPFNSDDSSDGTSPDPTTATLTAAQGQTGSGEAEFGFSGANLAANLTFKDLEPTADGESYTTWITGKKNIAYPINQGPVGEDGSISGQVAINQAIICFIAADAFTEMKVSRVSNTEMRASLREAANSNKGQGDFPKYVGTTVMQGPILMPEASKKEVLPSCNGNTAGSTTAP